MSDSTISHNKLSSLRTISSMDELYELVSGIGDWFYNKELEHLSYYNISNMQEKLECRLSRDAYKSMVKLIKIKNTIKAVYYVLVSGLWQKTNRYGYDNLTDSKRVKIDAEYAEEALEIIEYELYDNHEAVLEILG